MTMYKPYTSGQREERLANENKGPEPKPSDLDALSAEKIMGWHSVKDDSRWHEGFCPTYEVGLWHPTTDPAQAEMVRKAMEAKGWAFSMYTQADRVDVMIWWPGLDSRPSHTVTTETLTVGIIEVSLRAEGHIK